MIYDINCKSTDAHERGETGKYVNKITIKHVQKLERNYVISKIYNHCNDTDTWIGLQL